MRELGKETRECIQRLAECLKSLGTELKVTVGSQRKSKDDLRLGVRHADEMHGLYISLPGDLEDAYVTVWQLASRGSYSSAGEWRSSANHTLSNGPSELVRIIMSAFGVRDAPFPVIAEPRYKALSKEKALAWPVASWAVWHRSPDHGDYPESYYFSEEAAYWTAARFTARARRERLPFAWAIAPRRENPLTPDELDALAVEVGVNEDPMACLFLTKSDMERWVHPQELGV